jgi:hypothetical protein
VLPVKYELNLYILILGFCILLRVLLTVNNTFHFATIDKVFYYVASVLTTICYVEESRQPLWSSGQSSWLQNEYVLCFL